MLKYNFLSLFQIDFTLKKGITRQFLFKRKLTHEELTAYIPEKYFYYYKT